MSNHFDAVLDDIVSEIAILNLDWLFVAMKTLRESKTELQPFVGTKTSIQGMHVLQSLKGGKERTQDTVVDDSSLNSSTILSDSTSGKHHGFADIPGFVFQEDIYRVWDSCKEYEYPTSTRPVLLALLDEFGFAYTIKPNLFLLPSFMVDMPAPPSCTFLDDDREGSHFCRVYHYDIEQPQTFLITLCVHAIKFLLWEPAFMSTVSALMFKAQVDSPSCFSIASLSSQVAACSAHPLLLFVSSIMCFHSIATSSCSHVLF